MLGFGGTACFPERPSGHGRDDEEHSHDVERPPSRRTFLWLDPMFGMDLLRRFAACNLVSHYVCSSNIAL